MTRTLRATALAALAVVLTAAPAQTGTAGRGAGDAVTVRESRVELTPPLATRPMDEQCAVGGFNHPFCGRVVLDVTLAGFDAYGGVPVCTDPDDCSAEAPLATSTGGRARVDVLVRCAGEWFPRVRSLPVVVEAGPGPSDVSPASRVDSDAARLVFSFLLPSPSEIGACGPGATLLGAEVVRSLSLEFTGAAAGVPSWTTRLPGVHRVPLGR
ncbi:hypothetical protein [Kineococcus rubinsiae]|uniref:hypothetical protein n=1 Tax=Kineococcus rubinsiae TaxID=2609562 RepID=UPI00142F9DF0|nr:hypothetical protein [Kineococcus rubinsiae]NIZ90192.1 hypothetical protein [Kineococcus rubinsiae]